MSPYEGVVPALAHALQERGYETLTQVQEAVLAPELAGADALVSAQTGSGKTVAFGMALAPTLLDGADRFERARAPLALVVAPTRELALQVKRELEWLYAKTGASVASCVGGMDMRQERRVLDKGVHIVVGTPGRLRDHIERGSLDTSAFKAVVLDEADEMLDLGFRDDLEYILDAAPHDRRTLMFSATVGRTIANLAKRYQRDAVRISTQAEREQHHDIEYRALMCAPNDRENAIINVLRFYEAKNAIVFCATRATVNHMTSRLSNRGFSVVALSGELSQNERSHALQAMRDGRARVCVATDVAARGIDLPNLELVIHADVPKGREGLLHRSGRTGRAGRKGVSALIVPFNWRKRTERLLQNAQVTAAWAKPPTADEILARDRQRILEDENLSAELSEDDKAFAQELLAAHGPEQIAAAFLALHRAGQPAPEDLIVGSPRDERGGPDGREGRDKSPRNDFENGVWFKLSVGRKHTAEPRWLLPMLCRAGHITKRDIGAIKIHQTETHIELDAGCVDRFLEAVGPSRKVEKTITVERIDGVPEAPKRTFEKRGGKREDNKWDDKRSSKRAPKPYQKRDEPQQDREPQSLSSSPAPAPKKLREADIVEQFLGNAPPRDAKAPKAERTDDAKDWTKPKKAKGQKTYKPKKVKSRAASSTPSTRPVPRRRAARSLLKSPLIRRAAPAP